MAKLGYQPAKEFDMMASLSPAHKQSMEQTREAMTEFVSLQVRNLLSSPSVLPKLKKKTEVIEQHIAHLMEKQRQFMESVDQSQTTLLDSSGQESIQKVEDALMQATVETDSTLKRAFESQLEKFHDSLYTVNQKIETLEKAQGYHARVLELLNAMN